MSGLQQDPRATFDFTGSSGVVPRYSPGGSFLLILLCSTLFSTNIIAARLSGGLYDPYVVTLCRWAFVAIAISPHVLFVGAELRSPSTSDVWNVALYATFGLLLPSLLTFLAGRSTTAVNMTIIYSSTPGVIYVVVALTGAERIKLWPLIGFLISTVGVMAALYFGKDRIAEVSIRQGDILAALAVLSWAIYSVHVAGKGARLGLSMRLWFASLFCTTILFCYVLATGRVGEFRHLSSGFFLMTAFVALVPSILGYLLHAYLTRAVGVTQVGLMSYLVPVTAGTLAVVLLSETIDLAQLVAAGIVLLGVCVSGRR